MKKVIGYVAVVVGFLLVAISRIPTLLGKLSFIPKIVLDSLIYLGIGCIVLGIVAFFLTNSSHSSRSGEEVPIYRGNQIVGYRRH